MTMSSLQQAPWRDVDRLQRDLNDLFGRRGGARTSEFPPINIWTNDDGAIVTSVLPGIDPATVEIVVLGDTLTLKGERAEPTLADGRTFHCRERGFGAFNRTVQLAFGIDPEKVSAHYARGLLEITVPRAEAGRPRSITISGR